MNLLNTSLLNGAAVATRLAVSLALNKVLALYVGPTGYGVIGQLQSLIAMLGTFAGSAFNNGVTKYTAEYHDDLERQQTVWRTAATLSLCAAAIMALALILFRAPLARHLLGDPSLAPILVCLAATLVPLAFNGLMLAILNGRKAVVPFVLSGVLGSVLSAGCSAWLVTAWGLQGALLAVAISPALSFAGTAWLFRRHVSTAWHLFLGRIDAGVARSLGGYVLMTITSAVVVPLSMMGIREGMAQQGGWAAAGLWQALWKLSETHLMLLTTTLSVYFLPRFAEIRDGAELRAEVLKGYRFVLPLVFVTATLLYLGRSHLIGALFSDQFLALEEAFGIQLLGDILKISSWVTACTMVSHAQTRVFVVTEMLFASLMVIFILLGASQFGLAGAAGGYALTYGLYWIVVQLLFQRLVARMDASLTGGPP